ncbi:MAG: LLM class flavin-dependent oxidoreductase [Actinophytocola sp.]|uniref:LLM class flavin-dependent oxidoreductase n=1 Tax=Actinophytocola sp. TaxID=1872138 RepID=UPI0013227099|nr:LLM class flavin-dependent oxidoreductase [Actinophytocola sp.]MPZ85176.1 LLM class flavin-dependent oxidoreductase [Actinophytocola sp.]
MGTAARLGALLLPEHPGRSVLDVWRRAEDLGFDHAWVPDHLTWRTPRERPWFDAMTTLTAAAAATSRIALGTLVASPNFRHPVLMAKQAMAVDQLSEGRFVLGIGAGAHDLDNTALGGPVPSRPERGERFAEFVTLVDRLLRHPATTFAGRYYTAEDVWLSPGCVQRPRTPLAVAAAGPRGMRLAADLGDIWVTTGDSARPEWRTEDAAFRTWRRQLVGVDAACARVARPPDRLRRLVNLSRVVSDPFDSPERLADVVGRCAEVGFTDVVVPWPRDDGIFAGDQRAFEKAVLPMTTGAPDAKASN